MSAILTEQQQEALIQDADLRAALAAYDRGERVRKPGWRSAYVAQLAHEQQERAAAKAKTDTLPRDERRRALVRQDLEKAAPNRDDIRHIHSVLAICGLPHTRLPADQRDYTREQGRMALDVTAGFLRDSSKKKVLQPIPWGPKARLVLMHLCSDSIRQKSSTIEIADTFTEFVREMGFPTDGGKRGTLTAFKEQLNALAACSMKITTWSNDGAMRVRNITPIDEIDLWLSSDPDQQSLWPSKVVFSQAMYDSLSRHAIPLNANVIRALSGSSRKLDLYAFLGWRINNVDKPLRLSWKSLQEQFGQGFTRKRDFRSKFSVEIQQICEILPKLPATLTEDGLILQPAGPDVLALPSPRTKSNKS